MSPTVLDVNHLPPEGRFAIRALAAGLGIDEIAEVLRISGPTVRKHLRQVVRATGGTPPAASEPDNLLKATLLPAIEQARTTPVRRPALRCPEPEIADALAGARLDGPLMLAQAEHVADCAACMQRLVGTRRGDVPAAAGPSARGDGPESDRQVSLTRLDKPLVLGALLGLATALAYLFLR